MPTQSNWKRGLSLSLFATFLWALLPIGLKGLLDAMDSFTITWYRFVSAALVIGLFVVIKWRTFHINRLRGTILVLMLIAIFGLTFNYVCFLLGLEATTPSSTEVMIQLAPILLLLGSLVIFKETFNVFQWMGVAVFIVGLGLFFNHRWAEIFNEVGQYRIGFLWIIAASIFWAAYALTQKQLLKHITASHTMFYVYFVGTIILLPFSQPTLALELNWLTGSLLLFGCLNTLFAYSSFAEALACWEASRVSAVLTLTPLLTILFMQVIHFYFPAYTEAEPLNSLSIVGAVLVVVGSAFAALAKSKNKTTQEVAVS